MLKTLTRIFGERFLWCGISRTSGRPLTKRLQTVMAQLDWHFYVNVALILWAFINFFVCT